jgi:pimeloyl-ACP methyl ester carboxylesterase
MKTPEVPRPRRRRLGILALLAGLLTLTLGVVSSTAQASRPTTPKPTIVLVHGAFADASGWTDVIVRLQKKGYDVIAPANLLRGVAIDTQYLRDFLATIEGPVVLVGHSYGGFVMTNAAVGVANVEALVYIASFAPDVDETVGSISASAPGSELGPDSLTIRPYTKPDGTPSLEGYITPARYHDVFAADVDRTKAASYAASQRPADLSILSEPSGEPAWKTIPSWTMVAKQDHVIPPGAQEFMAQRAHATTVKINASHSVAVSHPRAVADFIIEAADSLG